MQTRAGPSLEGSVLGGYRVLGRHADGGMATVYCAEELGSRRRVALKVLRHPGPPPHDYEGLERERAALARVRHPHVVACLGDGVTPAGARFLVFEWLDGEDLRARLSRGPLDLATTLQLASEVSAALAAAHVAGVVHRDVKPANIVLAPDGHATLCDFGLAQGAGGERPSTLGTALYLAPELVGRRGRVDARADVYALGCVIFECLSGAPPFLADTVAQSLLRCLFEPAPRLCPLRPETPPWLEALVVRMLHKVPDERPRDGQALVALLAAAGAGLGDEVGEREAAPSHAHAFALLRVGDPVSDATVDIERERAPALAAICGRFGVCLDAPLSDMLVLTASDPEPRDQLRRLLGASLQMVGQVNGARLTILCGGGEGRVVQGALERGRWLLERAAPGSAWADDETRRLAPVDCASFSLEDIAPGKRALRVRAPIRARPPPLVGREAMIGRMEDALGRPSSGLVVLVGDAGMGKTAVLEAVRARLRPQVRHSLDGQLHLSGAPYHAVRTWAHAWLARAGAVDERTLRAELGRVVGKRAAWRAAELAPLLGTAASELPSLPAPDAPWRRPSSIA
ncbi:MAG: serine/threonine-protein kinase [Polyangiaceae bacterium]